MNNIEDYYQKFYNTDGLLTFINDEVGRQLIFYPIDVFDGEGNLIHAAKTFDETDVLTIQLRQREADLNQELDLSDQEIVKGKKGKR